MGLGGGVLLAHLDIVLNGFASDLGGCSVPGAANGGVGVVLVEDAAISALADGDDAVNDPIAVDVDGDALEVFAVGDGFAPDTGALEEEDIVIVPDQAQVALGQDAIVGV